MVKLVNAIIVQVNLPSAHQLFLIHSIQYPTAVQLCQNPANRPTARIDIQLISLRPTEDPCLCRYYPFLFYTLQICLPSNDIFDIFDKPFYDCDR